VRPNVGAIACADERDDDAADDDDEAEEVEVVVVVEGRGAWTGRAVYRTSRVAKASELIFLTAFTIVL
jgi:hypothetical protein